MTPTPGPILVTGTRWEGDRVLSALVGKILDVNRSPALGYSREELITMLDKHLQERESEGTP